MERDMAGGDLSARSMKVLQAFDFAAELAEKERVHEVGVRKLLLMLLDVMDSFDRALAAPPGDGIGEDWPARARLIARQLDRALAEAEVMPIACLGEAVDPDRHEIVEVKEVGDVAEDAVVEEIRRGWTWKGHMLRRPQVAVGRKTKQGEP
jgi:molecular chaperone GrpE